MPINALVSSFYHNGKCQSCNRLIDYDSFSDHSLHTETCYFVSGVLRCIKIAPFLDSSAGRNSPSPTATRYAQNAIIDSVTKRKHKKRRVSSNLGLMMESQQMFAGQEGDKAHVLYDMSRRGKKTQEEQKKRIRISNQENRVNSGSFALHDYNTARKTPTDLHNIYGGSQGTPDIYTGDASSVHLAVCNQSRCYSPYSCDTLPPFHDPVGVTHEPLVTPLTTPTQTPLRSDVYMSDNDFCQSYRHSPAPGDAAFTNVPALKHTQKHRNILPPTIKQKWGKENDSITVPSLVQGKEHFSPSFSFNDRIIQTPA
eukprot:15109188-Ditylum_brightwellii.AAC.1